MKYQVIGINHAYWHLIQHIEGLRPRQNGRHFPDDIFKYIFLSENVWIFVKMSLKFVPQGQLTIFKHWFRWSLDADQATSHYLNLWWLDYRRIYVCILVGLNELIMVKRELLFLQCKRRWRRCGHPLKRKCCHFDDILITDCTESCHFDNFRCSQWLKFRQNDDISVSVSSPADSNNIEQQDIYGCSDIVLYQMIGCQYKTDHHRYTCQKLSENM